MKNLLKNKRIIISIGIFASLICVAAIATDPGSEKDPLISLSYFENKIEELKIGLTTALSETLNNKFEELKESIEKTLSDIEKNGVSTPAEFEIITLNENETILCEAGTEIIVRSGKSIIVTSETSSGGISDITAGKDLINNEEITNNHLLIVPKADGRGIKATVTGAVMIKGKYTKQ